MRNNMKGGWKKGEWGPEWLGSESAGLELDRVAVAIALVLEVEDLGVASGGREDESGVEELEDSITNVGKIGLDLGSVVVDHGDVVLIVVALLLLLNGGDDGPRGSAVRCLQIWTSLAAVGWAWKMVPEIFWLRDGFDRIIWSLIYFGFDLDSKRSLICFEFWFGLSSWWDFCCCCLIVYRSMDCCCCGLFWACF